MNSDTLFTFTPNPFAKKLFLFNYNLVDKELKEIANIFKQRSKKEVITILVQAYTYPSMRDQAYTDRVLANIKIFFVEHEGLNGDLIFTNTIIGDRDNNAIEIIFTKE